MSEELAYIKQKLDEFLEECICDPDEIKELDEILKKIEYVIQYCQLGDQ
ncbi:hypothetical protein [Sulfuracidifex metallicus]|nr:hypothetical protein [Sulfuracidifex metallicus]